MTEDDKGVYPLAADTEKEMEEWMESMKKALKLDTDDPTGINMYMYMNSHLP